MANHFIIDFETFGRDPIDAAVVCLAYTVFDYRKQLTFNELQKQTVFVKLDVKEQYISYNYKINNEVLDWWKEQLPKEMMWMIKPSDDDVPVAQFIDDLIRYIRGRTPISYWWSRGNAFDPVILMRMARDVGRMEELQGYLKFWKVRDSRSFIDGATDFQVKNDFIPIDDNDLWNKHFVKHNCVHDIAADVMRLQKIGEE